MRGQHHHSLHLPQSPPLSPPPTLPTPPSSLTLSPPPTLPLPLLLPFPTSLLITPLPLHHSPPSLPLHSPSLPLPPLPSPSITSPSLHHSPQSPPPFHIQCSRINLCSSLIYFNFPCSNHRNFLELSYQIESLTNISNNPVFRFELMDKCRIMIP